MQSLAKEARREGRPLDLAYYNFKISDLRTEIARGDLEAAIIHAFNHTTLTVSEISKRSHTARGVIYRILHAHDLISNTQREEDDTDSASAETPIRTSATISAQARSSIEASANRSVAAG